MRVHIIINNEILKNKKLLDSTLDSLVTSGVYNINEMRLKLYGIMSCDIADESLDDIKKINGISVQIDQIKKYCYSQNIINW